MSSVREWINKNKDFVTLISEGLTALGVIAATAMFFWQWHSSKQADFNAALINSAPAFMSLVISNSGGVDLAIKRIYLKTVGVQGETLFPKTRYEQLLVEKGKSITIQFDKAALRGMAVDSDYVTKPDQPVADAGTSKCSIHIELIDAQSNKHSQTINYDCIDACFAIPQ